MSFRYELISFDLDDTLWPCAPTIIRAETALYEWLAEHVPEITQRYDMSMLRDKRMALMSRYPELSHDLSRLRMHSFQQLCEELNLKTWWMQPAFDVFYEARQRVELFDDVKPVLDKLATDYRLVSLTNGNADTVMTGVDHWFEFSLNSITVGRLKSEPEIYHRVQQIAGIDAQQMLHIGDDPVHDVAGAKSAGASAIWLNREGRPWPLDDIEPDITVSSLSELPGILKITA